MIHTRQIGKLTEISVTNGFLHKLNSDVYFKKGIILPTDTIDMYEEVNEIPPYTKADYDKKVSELVRERYSDSEEFAIQRKMLNSINGETDAKAIEEYEAYNAFVNECKERAKDAELYKVEENYDEEG